MTAIACSRSVVRLRAARPGTSPPSPPFGLNPISTTPRASSTDLLSAAFSRRSRYERDLSASESTPLFCDVANNAVIAVGKSDVCNQMSVIAQLAYCLHLISFVSVILLTWLAVKSGYPTAVMVIIMRL